MLLAQLRSASSYSEQAAALRSLKNEIVGHTQKKEALVAAGVLEPIVRMLSASSSSNKLNGKDSRFNAAHTRTPTEEEAVRLQAVQALSTIASGRSSSNTGLGSGSPPPSVHTGFTLLNSATTQAAHPSSPLCTPPGPSRLSLQLYRPSTTRLTSCTPLFVP